MHDEKLPTVDHLQKDSEYRKFVDNLVDTLNRLVDSQTTIIIGGKSRKIVETIIECLLPSKLVSDTVIVAWKNRIRLDQNNNKNIYHPDQIISDLTIKQVLESKVAKGSKILFIDDSLNTGRKAFYFISNLERIGFNGIFLSLSGFLNAKPDNDYLYPNNWQNLTQKVVSISSGKTVSEEIHLTSRMISFALDARLRGDVQEAHRLAAFAVDDLKHIVEKIQTTLEQK